MQICLRCSFIIISQYIDWPWSLIICWPGRVSTRSWSSASSSSPGPAVCPPSPLSASAWSGSARSRLCSQWRWSQSSVYNTPPQCSPPGHSPSSSLGDPAPAARDNTSPSRTDCCQWCCRCCPASPRSAGGTWRPGWWSHHHWAPSTRSGLPPSD